MSTSTTLPEHYSVLTSNNLSQDAAIYLGLVVSSILDVTILEKKHRELVFRWPVLGGKLVTNTKPYSFTTGDTVDFCSRYLSSSLEDTCLPAFTNISCDEPTYTPINPNCDDLFHFNSIPRFSLVEGLFALRVTVMNDATLLGFRIPHHFADGKSTFDIVQAYCDTVAGKTIPTITLPPDIPMSALVHGEDTLPKSVAEHAPNVHPEDNFSLGLIGYLKFVGSTLYKVIAPKVGLEEQGLEQFVHLPATYVLQLQARCQAELDEATKNGDLREGAGLQLTKNDIITAWLLRRAYANVPPDSGPFNLMYSFNYRQATARPAAGTTYLHNSFYNIWANFSSLSVFKSLPFSCVALEIRLCCVRNKQPSAVRSSLEFWETHRAAFIAPGKRPYRMDTLPVISPWTTFGYNDLDFSSALAAGEKGSGKVVFTVPNAMLMRITLKPFFLILKDGKGGYWIRANLRRSWWKDADSSRYL
ncbi:hypothetical protein BDQ12DRAFT_685767 [Crucibulum laeve]|uniref:Transferase n=1 Tax=Crucibulum laeve TaxID=68775 RepID=A0A5C3LWH6_9AGAR|nr:hypothetical protein BDQ12DRAFT_685767 [Crucibulum laeve]